jgi:hypothetical protein
MAPVLIIYDLDLPSTVKIDALDFAIGAKLN